MAQRVFFTMVLAFFSFTHIACQERPTVSLPPPPLPQAAASQPSAPLTPTVGVMYTTSFGMKYKDLEIGDGPRPAVGQTVTVRYLGKFEDGREFDKGKIDFPLGDPTIIKGWNIGIGGGKELDAMKVGGKRFVILPPDLAYGATGHGKIPPNTTITFEMELLKAQGSMF